MTLAAIYIRKSREDKDKPSHRLTVQREQLPAHAQSQGWKFKIYDDGHASAARGKTDDLRERAKLERDIGAGRINVVLVIELSRLSRDDSMQDFVSWLHLCAEHRVKLATMSRMLDPSQHSDWMLLLMEGGFSSVEMKVMKARMQDGFNQAFKAGKFLGGSPPLPYRYDHSEKKPVIDPAELPKMQQLWRMAETMSARAISQKMKLPEIFVRRSLSDDRLEFCLALRPDPETGGMIQCEWEPCLTPEEAARIRAGRRSRKTVTETAAARPSALLSALGILYCGYCGKTLKTWNNSRTRADGSRLNYYGCTARSTGETCGKSRMIPQFVLEEKILKNLFSTLSSIDDLKALWIAEQEKADPSRELKELQQSERQESAKKERLVSAVAEGIIDFADAKNQLSVINARLDELKKRQQDIARTIAAEPDWEALQLQEEEFSRLPQERQRQFLRIVLARVDVYGSYAVITYPFPRSLSGERISRIHLPEPKRGCGVGRRPLW